MVPENYYYATGKRKTAIARAWLSPGKGEMIINDQPADAYLGTEVLTREMVKPFEVTNTVGTYDVRIRVRGGGVSGQAGAIRHGITRALILANPDFRLPLKKAGYVKRDPRVKERKKYGQRGARARFQFSKR